MLRILALAAAMLCLGPVGPARSAPPATTTAVVLTADDEGLTAVYSLSRPLERFRFAASDGAEIHKEGWILVGDAARWDGDAIVRRDGRPLRGFQLRIRPDTQQRDRIYPALTRIGTKGWMIFEPHFAAAGDQGPTTVRLDFPALWTSLPAGSTGARPASQGFTYLGPKAYVAGGQANLVSGESVPPWLPATISGRADKVSAYFTRRLGISLPRPPLIIVVQEPGSGGDFRGDVTDGGIVSLRFYGDVWAREDTQSAADIGGFVAHEAFHFWNGWMFKPSEDVGEAWLNEGGAEYAALLAKLEVGDLDDAGMRAALGERMSGCAAFLEAGGLRTSPPRGGQPIYDCGVVAQWAADLQTRKASQGRRDVLDVWRELLNGAQASRRYDVAGFLALLPSEPQAPLTRLLEGGDDLWPRFAAGMAPLGGVATPARSAVLDRQSLMFHLLNEACGGKGPYGFYGEEDRIKFDAGPHCGAAATTPSADAVEGKDLMKDASAAFDAVQTACAARRSVTFTLKGKPTATLACTKPLKAAPMAWSVTRWR